MTWSIGDGVFLLDEVLDWTIFVDELSGSGGAAEGQGSPETGRNRGD